MPVLIGSFTTLWIYTILNPPTRRFWKCTRFTTLWIYTILKLPILSHGTERVLLPYGFTLFSNCEQHAAYLWSVLLPYGFTLFSNAHFGLTTRF